jgi:uncharacterized protein YndB with AHSA1/START domain
MPQHPDAILEDDQGRPTLRFERVLPHSPERVWRALTEPGELASWHPSPFELEPKAGGRIDYLPPDGALFGEGQVIEYSPPHLLRHTWGEDELRWELREHPDGCLLTLSHSFDDRLKAARDAAGWDLCLASLVASLDGDSPDRGRDADGLPGGWQELNDAYQRRFGISPEEATSPPAEAYE